MSRCVGRRKAVDSLRWSQLYSHSAVGSHDRYDMCGRSDGKFVTLFHTRKREPLERIARAFFARRWSDLDPAKFKSDS